MVGMEQELRRPEYQPRKHERAASALNCALASVGVTLMTFCLVGAAAVASVWAVAKLFAASDSVISILALISMVPVLFLSIWTAGRAWHVERRLAAGQDVDKPVYKTLHYFRGRTAG
jgi:isoprenylcysteine carboxyl methyltransferase (ICMT) family protein YpbQ